MKILFLGTHGQYNIGDELLLETFLSQLGREHHYAVNSYDPAFTQSAMRPQFDVESFHTTQELSRFLKYLLTSDLLVFGGGSIIKELYASVGRNPYSTLAMILATVTFTRLVARKPVVMSNIGVGPLMTPMGERLARWILKQVNFLSVRDDKSLQTCLRLGISPERVRRVPDAVFANQPRVFLPEAVTIHPLGNCHVALNLNYDIENRAAWEGFLSSLIEALRMWNQRQKLVIHALPMQSKFKQNDDLTVLKAFRERIPEIEVLIHDPQTAREAAGIMAGCDIVLAERLHALVIASILGKPFFGLVYDVKVRELVEYLGMTEYSININEPFSGETLFDGLTRLEQNRRMLQTHLLERSQALRDELAVYFSDLREKFLTR